jgi:hypothetical protein
MRKSRVDRAAVIIFLLLLSLLLIATKALPGQNEIARKYCLQLGSLDDNEREAAVKALAKIGKPALPELFKTLKMEGPYLFRMNAARALGLIGEKDAIKPLIEALKDEFANVRREAVTALGLIGDRSATPEILKIMETGNDDLLKAGAEALGRFKDKRAIPVLKRLSDHNNPDVARAAKEALSKI